MCNVFRDHCYIFLKKLLSSNLSSFYRLHEEIQTSSKACGSLDSLLLDIDFRYVSYQTVLTVNHFQVCLTEAAGNSFQHISALLL